MIGPLFFELPAPPSINAAWRNVPGKGRVRTAAYTDWLSAAGWRVRAQRTARLGGPVLVLIGVERRSELADIDNRIKPTLDLLVKQAIIEDDSNVIGVAAAWNPPGDGLMRVAVIPAADLNLSFQLAADRRSGGFFFEAASTEEAA